MWVEKYRPKSSGEMIGNEQARFALWTWLSEWKPGGKAALLVGPPGTGKTTMVGLFAKEAGMNLIDLNASDARTKERLRVRIGEAINATSLLGERSLVFLDEVDGLAGRSDYGAVEFIKDAVKQSRNPVVMAANDPESDEVRKLSSSTILVRFRPPPPREVEMLLREIARREGLSPDGEELRGYVVGAGGDVRNAINSLQSRSRDRALTYKDTAPSVVEAFAAFFDAKDGGEAAAALRRVPLQPLEKVRELQRSVVSSGLPPERLAAALKVMSEVDLLMGRIMKSGGWRMLRYLDRRLEEDLQPLVRGVKYSQEDLPFPVLLRIWNDSRRIRDVSERYAARAHTSGRSARSQDLPFVFALCSDKGFREGLEEALDLDEGYDKLLQKEAAR